jgi:CheY-like chemotaxis protein
VRRDVARPSSLLRTSHGARCRRGTARLPSSMDATEAPADLRVLVVDDDDDLRTLVVRVVEEAGYAVDSAADGQAGLDRLAGQIYDVILSDVRMPGMDGFAFYEEVRRRHPAQAERIILMTAHLQIAQYQEFTLRTRALTLQKPFTLGEFHAALARLLGPRAPRPPKVD